ncbi:hypothetical protein H7E67_15380 [Clostridium gasigenes]|uniref:hypothetical protein n=1 Tax=Clostridium gasigenes TaxID=94869 RepID=UPI0016258CCF|nr:hypothetical protein [Clostridium gasigenes]MBB6624821.1 hypothetical protein [Clostridium gasigenes]
MIRINSIEENRKSINLKVTQYVNSNLAIMIDVFLDYVNMNDGFGLEEKLQYIFPRDYLERNPNGCKKIIEELSEIIYSRVIREYIKPKYEYALYHIIQWWIDVQDNEEDLIPIKLNQSLRKLIESEEDYITEDGGNFMLEQLEDIDEYLIFCFQDHDFLKEDLELMVTLYIKSPEIFTNFFQDVNLDDYIDLMPVDLRELYIENRTQITNEHGIDENIEKEIVLELCNAIKLITNHSIEMQDKGEVEISNEVFRSIKRSFKLKFDVEVERESEIGNSKIKLGENDFYIYKNGDQYINVAIGENKNIENFTGAYGQVLGYLNHSFTFGFTILINRKKTMEDACKYIIENLKKNTYPSFKIIEIKQEPFGYLSKYVIKSTHIIPEDKERNMNIYHIILDLNNNYRKKVAIEARK